MKIFNVAVDLDGTITKEDRFPLLGEPNPKIVKALREARAKGETILIYTCRLWREIPAAQRHQQKKQIAEWLTFHMIPFDGMEGKAPANNYIDDRNLTINGFWAGKRHGPIKWVDNP